MNEGRYYIVYSPPPPLGQPWVGHIMSVEKGKTGDKPKYFTHFSHASDCEFLLEHILKQACRHFNKGKYEEN